MYPRTFGNSFVTTTSRTSRSRQVTHRRREGKVEAYNKIVISEFLEVEELKDKEEGKERYKAFVMFYNHEREHGGIGGMTPAEKFEKRLKRPGLQAKSRQKVLPMLGTRSVTHVW